MADADASPCFIVGCGRSGTTILGQCLSQHREVTYLHEPRHIWSRCYPQTDIWSEHARARAGKLELTPEDVQEGSSRKLRTTFRRKTLKTGRPVLIEKLPINSFRMAFLHAIFPRAKFVHIARNGTDVARSIGERADLGKWFGYQDYKWEQLVKHAGKNAGTALLPQLCTTNYERGLLEWRLSLEAVRRFSTRLPGGMICEISYEELIEAPDEVLGRVLSFLGLPDGDAVIDFARRNVKAQRARTIRHDYTVNEKEILGQPIP
jgi:Sulfotransferase family